MPEMTAVREHTVNITELVCQTKEKLRSYSDNQDHHEKKELICRVLKKYHEIDGSDYVPRRWSIGPYHKHNKQLENMEIYKVSSLNYICKHFPATLEKFYEELQSLETEARRYYSGDINMDTPSFLQMLLLDSCFVIDTVILKVWNKPADSIFNSSNTGSNSMRNNAENHGAQNSNQSNPGFAGNEISDQINIQVSREGSDEYNIQVYGEGSDEYNPADPIFNSSNTGSNLMRNNRENHGAQISNQSNPGFAGNENSDQNNIQVSREGSDKYNPSAIRPSIFSDVLHDLLLFENQIPFFILQRMYNIATGDETPNERVACQLGIMLMVFIQDISITTMEYEAPPKKIHHLLHLFHWSLRPLEKQNDHSQVGTSWLIKRLRLWYQAIRNRLADLQWKRQTDNNQQQKQFRRWRRAVEYHEAGVHFKLPQQLAHSPLDIKFENGELRIPKLIIDEKTSFIFGNLLAFEQETAQFRDFFITTYITFMSQLLSKPEDVMLLSQKGIIENHLGCNEDVSELFNNLTKFRFLELGSTGYLKSVCCALEKHYENPWNHWFAWLRHRHMTNPWLILSLVAAAVVAISAMVDPWLIPYVRRKYHQ